MQAVVFDRYGAPDVLTLTEVDKPVPGDGEVLVRVHATTVTTAECLMRQGLPRWGRPIIGFRRPRRKIRTLGLELAGEVEAVGAGVRRFSAGDRVFGFTGFGAGAYAEYKCMPESGSLARMPAGLTFTEAAASVDGATTAMFFLRDKAKVQSGQRVLVIGASGSIGTYAVQFAKQFGADVTAVCSGRNAELVTSLGADRVVDYTQEDYADGGVTYDVVFDTVGRSSFGHAKRVLTPRGCYMSTTGLTNLALSAWTSVTGGRQVRGGFSVNKREALEVLREQIEAGRIRVVVDREFRLNDIVEAHRYVDTGRKRGNVTVTVGAVS